MCARERKAANSKANQPTNQEESIHRLQHTHRETNRQINREGLQINTVATRKLALHTEFTGGTLVYTKRHRFIDRERNK